MILLDIIPKTLGLAFGSRNQNQLHSGVGKKYVVCLQTAHLICFTANRSTFDKLETAYRAYRG